MRYRIKSPYFFLALASVFLGVSVVALWVIREKHLPVLTAERTFPALRISGEFLNTLQCEYEDHGDFYIWHATPKYTHGTQAGVYFGTAPKFAPNPDSESIPGKFAGLPTKWYRSGTTEFPYSADTLLPYRHSSKSIELRLHIWVRSETDFGLQEMLRSLSSVTLIEEAGTGHISHAP